MFCNWDITTNNFFFLMNYKASLSKFLYAKSILGIIFLPRVFFKYSNDLKSTRSDYRLFFFLSFTAEARPVSVTAKQSQFFLSNLCMPLMFYFTSILSLLRMWLRYPVFLILIVCSNSLSGVFCLISPDLLYWLSMKSSVSCSTSTIKSF